MFLKIFFIEFAFFVEPFFKAENTSEFFDVDNGEVAPEKQ